MTIELHAAMKLTISVGGDERLAHHPLYQEVVRLLHHEEIAGATLTNGMMSFGVSRSIHYNLNEITMGNLPIIIEAVDEPAKVERAAAAIAEILGKHGLVTMQPTMLVRRASVRNEGGQT